MAEKLYGEHSQATSMAVMKLDNFLSEHKIGNVFR